VFTDMENWAEIRRRVLVDGQSKRSVCREFEIHWDTLQKILDHPEPPGYHRTAPRPRPKLDPFLPVIHQILEGDRKAPRKQRHTARRVFERLRDEYGYKGGLTAVKAAVAAWSRSPTIKSGRILSLIFRVEAAPLAGGTGSTIAHTTRGNRAPAATPRDTSRPRPRR
jgi:hypothetical protein